MRKEEPVPDPIETLMQDHREVEGLFQRYRQSKGAGVVERICTELTVHAAIEERVVYPALGAEVRGGKSMRQHAEKEHQEVKDAIFEIERLGYTDPGVDQQMQTIMTGVTEHVGEEEGEVFPKMREDITPERLSALGEELAGLKRELLAQAKSAGPLIDLTKEQLYELAQDKGLEGRSDMSKDELISALRRS
jgi:hemerythrin superfamily protein